jgi:rod shape-determining protein MreC
MRVRKRHAWSAVLLVLFALPVVKPEGFPGFEGAGDSAVCWFARAGALNPHGWFSREEPSGPDSARVRDLTGMLLASRAEEYRLREEMAQREDLREWLSKAAPLTRVPKAVMAKVLRARDASRTRRSIAIDRGTEDGVAPGLAVVQGRTFLGTVASTRGGFARVQLLTDPHARLEVAVVTSGGARAVGYLRGGGDPDRLALRFVRRREGVEVRPGDPVVTGNGDERVPSDLLVGYVVEAGRVGPDGVLEVVARSQMDLESATTVQVLVPAL